MGWSFLPANLSKEDVISELTHSWKRVTKETGETCGVKYLVHKYQGGSCRGVLYVVGQFFIEGKPERDEDRFILVILVDSKKFRGVSSWGYKEMDESMHPYYYSCPLDFLEMVPKVRSVKWRERVLEWHTNKRA